MRKVCAMAVVAVSLTLAGCDSIGSAWDSTVGAIKMPDMSSFGFDDKPKQSACVNPLCDGLPDKECREIPYCQKP